MNRLMLVILAIALTSSYSTSQTRPDAWDNLKQLRERDKIKLVDTRLRSWTGNFVSVSEEEIVLRTPQGLVSVERANVLRVTNLGKSKRKRNAAIGFAICGIPAGSLVARRWGADIYAVLLGGWAGGLCAGVGALIPNYPTVYRAQVGPQGVAPDPQGSSGAPPASQSESEGVR